MNESIPKIEQSASFAETNMIIRVLVETLDTYVRSVAEISAETGLSEQLTVEGLMSYCLALPEADELILGFLRGDLTMFSLEEQTRQIVERDTRFLELESPISFGTDGPNKPDSKLGRNLALRKKPKKEPGAAASGPSALEEFIRKNPEVFRQVENCSREFLIRWVMHYLMQMTEARERGHKIAHRFWQQHPGVHLQIVKGLEKMSSQPRQRPGLAANEPKWRVR